MAGGGAVRIQVLGAVRAWRDDAEVDLGPTGRRAVLGLLALAAAQPLPRAEIVHTLWRDRPPPSATNIIQTHVKHLRRLLEPGRPPHGRSVLLPSVGDGYALRVTDVDVQRFRELTAAAGDLLRGGAAQSAPSLLGQALRLWRGTPLADVPALAGHPKVIGLLGEQRSALRRYADLMISAGAPADVLPVLEEVAAGHPLDEAVQTRLIRAYHAAGQQARAFAAYHAIRRRLVDELGVDPGPELAAAHRALLNDQPPAPDAPAPGGVGGEVGGKVGGEVGPPVPAADPPRPVPSQLPAEVPAFVGRGTELAELDRAFAASSARTPTHVCVISGMAGIGKTALAVHWAHRGRQLFPCGQLYVDLHGYDPERPVTPGDVLARFLDALGVSGGAVPLDLDERATRFRTEISGRRMLLILDNAASVEQVRPLLPGTPSCAVVVTSRDSLAGLVALHGARRLVLDPLPLPDAVSLLHELIGARANAQPGATVALAGLCAQLPLALRVAAELAASRNLTALTDLVEELGDRQRRLRLLDAGGDPRAAVSAVFSWSYQHLAADTARAFRLLGRHPGPEIERYAVAALTGAPLDRADALLDQLARAHLVQYIGLRRYGMHELLRVYAADLARAEESEAAQIEALSRLLDYYLATAAAAMDSLYPAEGHHRPRIEVPAGTPLPAFAEPALARAWLDAERPTLVAVCGYAAGGGWPAHTVRLAATLYRYLESGHHSDALTIHTSALHAARTVGDLSGQAHALTNLGTVHRLLGGYERATHHLRQALALHERTGDSYGTARTLSNLGIVDDRLGRHESAARHQRQALDLFRGIEDRYGEAGALTNLGAAEESLGRYESAAEYHRQAYTLFGGLGDPVGEAIALANLGDVETRLARYAQAAEHLGQALALFQAAGHRYGEAITLANLGQAEARLAWYGRAAEHLGQALVLFRATGHRYGEASVLNALGEVMHATGRPGDALAHHTTALRIATDTGDRDERLRAQRGIDLAGPTKY